jgi:hypothetical protein
MNCTINARFTAAQADLLYVGLRPLIINHLNLIHTGRSPASHPEILTLRFVGKRGAYRDDFMQAIKRLWEELQLYRGNEFRTSLDYIQLSACALALRTALRQVRHGHVVAWTTGIESSASRLLRRLEAMRKRLKRTITRTKGHTSFSELSYDWHQFLRWARLNLLTCPCLIRRPNLLYRSRQRLIDAMVSVATVELQRLKRTLPPPRTLRKVVRDSLKNVRRLRTPWTIPLLRRNPQIADWWVAEYIIQRMAH